MNVIKIYLLKSWKDLSPSIHECVQHSKFVIDYFDEFPISWVSEEPLGKFEMTFFKTSNLFILIFY